MAHLAQAIITQTHGHQNLIRDPAHFKLELDAFVLPLSLKRVFPDGVRHHGYYGRCANLASLPKNESGFAADDPISILDSIRNPFKFVHMAV